MAITLRAATVCAEDIALYAKIEIASESRAPGTIFIPTVDPEEIRQDLERNLVQFISLDEVVGLISTRYDKPKHLYVSEFAVVVPYQGRGVGTAAMQARILPELDALERIWLDVRKRNSEALRLYERLGFAVIDEIYNLHSDGYTWLVMDLLDRDRFRAAVAKA